MGKKSLTVGNPPKSIPSVFQDFLNWCSRTQRSIMGEALERYVQFWCQIWSGICYALSGQASFSQAQGLEYFPPHSTLKSLLLSRNLQYLGLWVRLFSLYKCHPYPRAEVCPLAPQIQAQIACSASRAGFSRTNLNIHTCEKHKSSYVNEGQILHSIAGDSSANARPKL